MEWRTGDRATGRPPTLLEVVLAWAQVDLAPDHRPPRGAAVVLATVVSVAGSLLADALLVGAGTAAFPATVGYVHFRFSDYAKLTVVGVLIACLAWPVVTRITSAPRWMFFRMAIAVTVVLLLPDLWLLLLGDPPEAVLVLICMHLAIALVTYNCLVHLAPARRRRRRALVPGPAEGGGAWSHRAGGWVDGAAVQGRRVGAERQTERRRDVPPARRWPGNVPRTGPAPYDRRAAR